ncbi:MAG: hypothetical protein SPH18_05325, partial [Sutterella parvirubra]|nr:hypothetical protein [Sutterella parvirubra]
GGPKTDCTDGRERRRERLTSARINRRSDENIQTLTERRVYPFARNSRRTTSLTLDDLYDPENF